LSASAVTATESVAEPLTERELGAWRGLLRSHALLVKRLDAELEAAHGLALTSYEVLLHLSHAEERKMRMCDVAESVLLSRSGLTRLIDRLERDGFVERVSCADDARGAYAHLTAAGHAKLREAQHTHLEGVREHFLRHFGDGELELLGDAWNRVAGAGAQLGPGCDAS
jgi:DNA-binding MarR family transcriptional regulator